MAFDPEIAAYSARRPARRGFDLTALVGVEGPVAYMADIDDWLDDPERRAVLLRALERIETEPSLLGASPHLLAVASRYGVGR